MCIYIYTVYIYHYLPANMFIALFKFLLTVCYCRYTHLSWTPQHSHISVILNKQIICQTSET